MTMMLRIAIAAGTAVVLGGAAAGTAAEVHDAGNALARVVAADVQSASITDAPSHVAVVHAPAGTALLAVASGALSVSAVGHVVITGSDDDDGLVVEYTGLDDTVPDGTAQRGDVIGHILNATHNVTVRASLDGEPLDTPALLRAALDGIAASDTGWVRPVTGAVVSQPFGCTPLQLEPFDRSCPSHHFHSGIDLAAPMGTPVHAALDGVVRVVISPGGYGLHVVLDSGDGLTTLYGHLQSVDVHDGDEVAAGDAIGRVGSTGNSTGPHLHFEVRRDGIPEDPTLDVALP
jgi:murein DD-endopeptidase MepM/ murein hydrolase activator NlpD